MDRSIAGWSYGHINRQPRQTQIRQTTQTELCMFETRKQMEPTLTRTIKNTHMHTHKHTHAHMHTPSDTEIKRSGKSMNELIMFI